MGNKKRLDTEVISNAAAELAEEDGFEKITLTRLAKKLGVKSPSLYNHLDGLSELPTGLAKLSIRGLEEVVRNAAVGRSKADALMEIAHSYRKFVKENPQLYKIIPKLPAYEDSEIKESGQDIVRILYQVIEPYHYSQEDTTYFMRAFRSALHGFVSLEETGFFRVAIDANESYTRLVSGLISTLTAHRDS